MREHCRESFLKLSGKFPSVTISGNIPSLTLTYSGFTEKFWGDQYIHGPMDLNFGGTCPPGPHGDCAYVSLLCTFIASSICIPIIFPSDTFAQCFIQAFARGGGGGKAPPGEHFGPPPRKILIKKFFWGFAPDPILRRGSSAP
jgi:hypothetical protein